MACDGAAAVSDETPRAEVGPDAEGGGGETAPDRRQASVDAKRGGGREREAGKRRVVGRGQSEVLIRPATEIQWTLCEVCREMAVTSELSNAAPDIVRAPSEFHLICCGASASSAWPQVISYLEKGKRPKKCFLISIAT